MKRSMYYQMIVLVLLTGYCAKGMAQTDTINFGNRKLLTKQLKTGLKQYLVYAQNPKQGKKMNISIWTRDIKKTIKNEEKSFIVLQKWYGSDTAAYRKIYSVNRESDFSPVYHSELIGNQIKAFNWFPDHINGADSIVNNQQNAFNLKFDFPCFNWNLDIETFEMLPLAAGKKFVIPFYDAGFSKPAYTAYHVAGSEVIQTLDGKNVDCWKLVTEGDHDKIHYSETFWISKKEHEFLMEEDAVNGMFRYKIKLPAYSPDFIKRFN